MPPRARRDEREREIPSNRNGGPNQPRRFRALEMARGARAERSSSVTRTAWLLFSSFVPPRKPRRCARGARGAPSRAAPAQRPRCDDAFWLVVYHTRAQPDRKTPPIRAASSPKRARASSVTRAWTRTRARTGTTAWSSRRRTAGKASEKRTERLLRGAHALLAHSRTRGGWEGGVTVVSPRPARSCATCPREEAAVAEEERSWRRGGHGATDVMCRCGPRPIELATARARRTAV